MKDKYPRANSLMVAILVIIFLFIIVSLCRAQESVDDFNFDDFEFESDPPTELGEDENYGFTELYLSGASDQAAMRGNSFYDSGRPEGNYINGLPFEGYTNNGKVYIMIQDKIYARTIPDTKDGMLKLIMDMASLINKFNEEFSNIDLEVSNTITKINEIVSENNEYISAIDQSIIDISNSIDRVEGILNAGSATTGGTFHLGVAGSATFNGNNIKTIDASLLLGYGNIYLSVGPSIGMITDDFNINIGLMTFFK